jgi:hypothetical protein
LLTLFWSKGSKKVYFLFLTFQQKSITDYKIVTTLYTFSKINKVSHSAFTQQKLNNLRQKVSRFRQKVSIFLSILPAEKSIERSKKSKAYNVINGTH